MWERRKKNNCGVITCLGQVHNIVGQSFISYRPVIMMTLWSNFLYTIICFETLSTRCLFWDIPKQGVDLLNYSHCSNIWSTNSSLTTLNLYFHIIINSTGVNLSTIMNKVTLERKDVDLGDDLVGWLLKDIEASESLWAVYLDVHRVWISRMYGQILCYMDIPSGEWGKYQGS